jgi:hypothetical protein
MFLVDRMLLFSIILPISDQVTTGGCTVTEKPSQDQMNKMYFMNLVIMLGTTAMQQLGKIVNPTTNKEEIDLQGAQATIDLLLALQAKTTGNLESEEEGLLTQTVSSLQMNFVETSAKTPEDTGSEDPEAPETTPDAATDDTVPSDAGDDEGASDKTDKKDPKFRKTYE